MGTAHDTGDADGSGGVRDQEVLDVERALLLVQGGDLLPRGGTPHDDVAGEPVEVVAVVRLAELEHDVVGDVHREGDGADAGEPEPGRHPRRRGPGGVDAAHGARDEAVAAGLAVDRGVVVDLDAVAAGEGRGGLHPGRRVGEDGAGGVSVFTRHAADGEAVAAVGGDVDFRSLVVEAEQLHRVGAELRVEPDPREHQDAVMVLADAQFTDGGDHAGGEVAVGLTGGDAEVARQHGAREGDHHLVAFNEVVGAADDPLHAGGVDAIAGQGLLLALGDHPDLAPVDGLAVGLGFLDDAQDLAHHDRAAEVVRGAVDLFFFEAYLDEFCHDVFGRCCGRYLREFTQPGKGDTHC